MTPVWCFKKFLTGKVVGCAAQLSSQVIVKVVSVKQTYPFKKGYSFFFFEQNLQNL